MSFNNNKTIEVKGKIINKDIFDVGDVVEMFRESPPYIGIVVDKEGIYRHKIYWIEEKTIYDYITGNQPTARKLYGVKK